MGQILQQFHAIWKKLGVNQKATILMMLVGLAAGIGALVHVSRQPSFEMLYSDLDDADLANVVSYLKDSNIPYRVTNNGRTVMVAEGQKYDARIQLASKGLLTGGRGGLDIIETNGWTTSPMAEQMLKRRAIQGELARTVTAIEQIAWADVQIAQPVQSPFAEDQKPATAAITVRTRAGAALRPGQVAAISSLVAGSVEGLEPNNVSVIDATTGKLLSSPRTDSTGAEASDRDNFRQAIEERLAAKAQALLTTALGPGRSVVKVSAVVDMNRVTETVEDYFPDRKVATMEKTLSRSSSGGAGDGSGTQAEEETTSNYQVPKTVRSTQTAPGTIKRLDVAVVVDPTYTDADGKEATLDDAAIAELEELVKRAVGLDDKDRGDTIKMHAMAFNKPSAPAVETTGEDAGKKQYYLQIAKYGSSVATVVLFALFVTVAMKRTARATRTAPGAEGGQPTLAGPSMMAIGPGLNGNGHAKVRNRVKDIISGNPTTAARLLQRWMNEDDSTQKG